jgi:hypothetical protein
MKGLGWEINTATRQHRKVAIPQLRCEHRGRLKGHTTRITWKQIPHWSTPRRKGKLWPSEMQ